MSTRRDVMKAVLASLAATGWSGCDDGPEAVGETLVIDLVDAPELGEIGGWLIHSVTSTFILVIARVDAETVIALDALCTHQQCALRYQAGNRQLACPCHGSTFTEQGQVTSGPAERPLRQYPTAFDGQIVTIELSG